jgi:hypothetical protein
MVPNIRESGKKINSMAME